MPKVDALSVILGTLFLLCAFVFTFVFTHRKEKDTEEDTKSRHDRIDGAYTKTGDPENDMSKIMVFNMKKIDDFITISKHQSRRSFAVAIASFVTGLILFGGAIIYALSDNGKDGAIYLSICGVITEFLSGSNMMIYSKAQEQLNRYYIGLHENERFLSAVKIVEYITREKRDEAIAEIIRGQVGGAEKSSLDSQSRI